MNFLLWLEPGLVVHREVVWPLDVHMHSLYPAQKNFENYPNIPIGLMHGSCFKEFK